LSSDGWVGYDYYKTKPYHSIGASGAHGMGPERLDAMLTKATAERRRYWVIYSQYAAEDREALNAWLGRNATKVDEQGFKDVLVALWTPRPPGRWEAQPSTRTALVFAGGLSLVGFDVADQANGVVAPRCGLTPPICSVKLSLFWRTDEPVARDLRVSTKLVDAEREVWGHFDLAPSPYYPLAQWRPGAIYREERYIPVLPGAPRGDYTIRISAYDADTGAVAPVRVAGGSPMSDAPLTTITLAAPPEGWPVRAVRPAKSADFGATRLVGADVGPLVATAGHHLSLTTFWQHGAVTPNTEMVVSLRRRDAVVAEWSTALGVGSGVSAVKSRLPLPGDLPTDEYELRLAVRRDGQILPTSNVLPFLREDSVRLAIVSVSSRVVRRDLPSDITPLRAQFAGGAQLVGYTLHERVNGADRPLRQSQLSPEATHLIVTLYWRAAGPTTRPLSVFVHALNAHGALATQHDGPPGDAPSTAWVAGEALVGQHPVPVERLGAGVYRVVTGLYDPVTGTRVATTTGEQAVTVVDVVVSGR
ncbi:MAG: hypothetical protein NZ518_06025, partial [Dehalococcoidia bacterium]|nr:hypothetical protein [Dehalococcoidia bacterium]